MPTAAPSASAGRRFCPTRVKLTGLPSDLKTWSEAAAALAFSPHPMSERDLRRKFKAGGRRRTYRIPGVRGELVSEAAVWEFHRDLHRGWLSAVA